MAQINEKSVGTAREKCYAITPRSSVWFHVFTCSAEESYCVRFHHYDVL